MCVPTCLCCPRGRGLVLAGPRARGPNPGLRATLPCVFKARPVLCLEGTGLDATHCRPHDTDPPLQRKLHTPASQPHRPQVVSIWQVCTWFPTYFTLSTGVPPRSAGLTKAPPAKPPFTSCRRRCHQPGDSLQDRPAEGACRLAWGLLSCACDDPGSHAPPFSALRYPLWLSLPNTVQTLPGSRARVAFRQGRTLAPMASTSPTHVCARGGKPSFLPDGSGAAQPVPGWDRFSISSPTMT